MAENKSKTRKDVCYTIIDQKVKNNEYSLDRVPCIGHRHFQVMLYFLILTTTSCIEMSMSVAIVAMMDFTMNPNPAIPTYSDWTSKNVILSSYYWLFAPLQLFSGVFVHKYGPKCFIVGGTVICSLLHVTIPQTAAWFGSTGVMAVRILQGGTQSVYSAALHHLLSQWAPAEERATMGSIVYSGFNFGLAISMWLTGNIAASHYGWPLIFYIYGVIGLCFSVLGAFFIFESPAVYPYISENEKFYIESSLGHLDEKSHPKTPWKKILYSSPFWALLLSNCGDLFGSTTLINQLPSYLKHVMDFDIQNSSFFLTLPYIALIVMTPVFSILSDYSISRKLVSITTARKISNTIGLIAPALALFYMSFVDMTNPIHVIILLTVVFGINAAPSSSGWIINHMDLSPNYADSMMGLTSGAANICIFMSPLIADFLVTDETNTRQWSQVFLVTACIYSTTAIVYAAFGSGKLQSWNDDECLDNEKGKPEE